MTTATYIQNNPSAAKEIQAINTIFAPFALKVNEVIRAAQSVKYVLKMPLDVNIQGKIRRNQNNIKYALSSAIASEYVYGHENDYVYIERPADLQAVKFESFADGLRSDRIKLALGLDQNGRKVITDLAKAPHILVAGTTGSGKSELLHSFICSIIAGMSMTKAELLLIDPKRAEFSAYKNCKRTTLVTDMSEAPKYLAECVNIMEDRYSKLESAGAKDIYHYSGNDIHPVIIVIDELADLIIKYPNVENDIVRIAQKARACGIHLIIGTQSPRRDVVTGLIKANIPTKIALRTTNQVESRIILDRNGAEKLFGKGDMLFMGNGSFEPIRLQGAYVSEEMKYSYADVIRRSEPLYESAPQETAPKKQPKPRKLGLFGTMKALWNVKPIMFQTNEYPPHI